jgi:hypothetical protein
LDLQTLSAFQLPGISGYGSARSAQVFILTAVIERLVTALYAAMQSIDTLLKHSV